MKRKTIFIALFSVFVACFFVACSNDGDAFDINALDVKPATRSVGLSSYMTREEIQARLNEIGEKYGTRVLIDESVDMDLVNEDIFTKLEEHLSSKQETKANRINTRAHILNETSNDSFLMNDSSIDDIMLMAAPPSGEMHSGSFDVTVHYQCVNQQNIPEDVVTNVTISWTTMSSGVSGSLVLSAKIGTGHGNSVVILHSNPGGTPSSPSFDYTGTIQCRNTVLMCDTIFMKDEFGINDGINHLYDQFINGDSARFEYHYEDLAKKHEFSGSYPK